MVSLNFWLIFQLSFDFSVKLTFSGILGFCFQLNLSEFFR